MIPNLHLRMAQIQKVLDKVDKVVKVGGRIKQTIILITPITKINKK